MKKTPLHIALVTETWRPEINGVAMTLGRMADGLLALGHRITLVRPRQHGEDKGQNAPGLREVIVGGCPLPGYRGLRFGLPARNRLLKEWREDRPDIVQVATEGPLGGSAIAAARRLDIPAISEFHTNFHAYSRHYGFGWLEGLVAAHLRRLHNRSAVTLAPTFAVARELTENGYRDVRVVSRGVDTSLFHPSRRSNDLRRCWGAGDDTLVVAYVGRLAAEKNLPLVQRAFAAIHKSRPEARLLFVGDGPLRARLERENPDYLFAGMRRGTDLAAHYASADLFLFPSLTETFGNVTTEALASGLAVLAYDCAAAAEVIADRHNGRLAAADDESGFIQAAIEMAGDGQGLRAIRQCAAPSVAHLAWEQINANLVQVMHDVIDSHGNKHFGPLLLRAEDQLPS